MSDSIHRESRTFTEQASKFRETDKLEKEVSHHPRVEFSMSPTMSRTVIHGGRYALLPTSKLSSTRMLFQEVGNRFRPSRWKGSNQVPQYPNKQNKQQVFTISMSNNNDKMQNSDPGRFTELGRYTADYLTNKINMVPGDENEFYY